MRVLATNARDRLRAASLTSQILLATLVACVLLIAAFTPAIQALASARGADAAQDQADRARAQATSVLGRVLDLETGSRGFIITGRMRFLEPWQDARVTLPRELAELERLSAETEGAAALARRIKREATSYLRDYSEPQVARAVRSRRRAISVVASGEGKRRVDRLRVMDARLIETISGEAGRRRSDQLAAENRALVLGGVGLALALSLMALFAGYLRSAIGSPLGRLAEGARALAGGALDARVAGGGPREFALLADSFNEMAASLQSSRSGLESANRELVEARLHADRANAAKSEFLSRMSHELRTPLNSIIGFSQLLELEDLDEAQRESVERVLKAAHHLLEMINEVLDISRIEAGELGVSLEPVDAEAAIGKAAELIRPMAADRGLDIELSVPEGERYVIADDQRLTQVLLNLLSNAVKYNREAATIRVAVEPRDGQLAILVSDGGRGLTPEQIERLFVPFDRLGAEGSGVEGTGLGLALSRRLVDAMHGTLEVQSEPGVGSTFAVSLPVAADTVPASDVRVEPPAERPASGPAATVLYIEDNAANLRLVERILATRPNTRLLTAMHGRLGLDLAEQHRPDLIILDLHLPDLDGDDILRRLRANPLTESLPVIILTADATARRIGRLLAEGAQAYLTKPLEVTEFLATVERIIAETRAAAAP